MGATALHQPDIWNAPRVGNYVINPEMFSALTQRMDIPQNTQTLPGSVVGERLAWQLPARGVISDVRLHFDLSVLIASFSAQTLLDNFPYGLIRQLTIRANNTALVSCTGMDLKILRAMRYRTSDFSDIETTTVAGSNGAKDVDFFIDVPLCTDPTTRTGSVFAQTEDTKIEVDIQFESQANLATLTGGTTWTWSGVIRPEVVSWEIPQVTTNAGRAVVLPDLGVHSMIGSRNTFIAANTKQKIGFSRTYGQLLRYAWTTWDESAKGYLNALTAGPTNIVFQYGQNQRLREHAARHLLHLNAQWYRDILPNGYLCLDFVSENSFRDVVVPGEVMDMEVELDYTAATALANGDYVHTLEQVVIPNDVFAGAAKLQGAQITDERVGMLMAA